jgi:signal transduction histidine kinase
MLDEFIAANRAEIIARAQERVSTRQWPPVATAELVHGVPLFLTQLTEALRLKGQGALSPRPSIGATAARHGGDLKRLGFTVSQVVHDYGDVCQAITALAAEQAAPITVDEFHTLNHCLDTAIAEAVTEHARVTAHTQSAQEVERLGQAAHELRDLLNTAILAFQVVKQGTVAVNGTTGAVLGRSLLALRDIIDRTLTQVRLSSGNQTRVRVSVSEFISEIGAAAMLHADYRDVQLTVDYVPPELAVDADPQLLASAVMNLLVNALKHTPAGGRVVLRTIVESDRLLIEIEDQCGGLPERTGDLFQVFGERRGRDRSGLGLGLSIARKAARTHGGDIHTRNLVGQGCVFIVELPLGRQAVEVAPSTPEM